MRPLYRFRKLARRLPQQGPKRPALDASGSNFHSRLARGGIRRNLSLSHWEFAL